MKEFSNEYFCHNVKAFLTTASATSSRVSSISEELWKHTREPIKSPLLAKLSNKDAQSHQAIQIFTNILRYMGDLPSNRQRFSTAYTDQIFGPALQDVRISLIYTTLNIINL